VGGALADTFSDGEIDALLAALSTEEIGAEKQQSREQEQKKSIKTYNFKRALRFSQDQIRTLTRIHENYARFLSTYLSAQLRAYVQVSVSSVDQMPYEEFIHSVHDNSVLAVFNASPLQGRMIMEMQSDHAYVILDRMLGGQGMIPEVMRDFTEIEASILKQVLDRSLNSFRDAWASIVALDLEVTELEMNPQFLQIVSPNETVVVVSLYTKIGEAEGIITLCLPHIVLEPVMSKLVARHWLATQKKTKSDQEIEALENRVKHTKLLVKAILGHSDIEVNEFLNLSIGDVIRLNETTDAGIVVKVDEQSKFFAQPGVQKGKIAVQITDVINEGDELE
jgi:flagellar motor switch protein FliM